ncbi:MAG TPA: Na+ dependent nucleoside transporter N-terminal domain-containing protein, partial [Ignavibacteriaceae bacterium]
MNLESFIRGIFGLALLIGIAFLISNNKKKINWRLVISGFGLQIIFAILILRGDSLRNYFSPL